MIGMVFRKVVKPPYVWARATFEEMLFERRFGVKTAGTVPLAELGVDGEDRNHYLPAGLFRLRRILPPREVTTDDVLLDLGSGMGRVVLQAALHYPFRRVIGIELSDQLHDIAVQNIATNRERLRCQDVSLVHGDVLDYSIPDDVTVVFIYNSFGGAIFQTVVDRMLESVDRAPRRMRIIYGNPAEEAALLASGRVRMVRALRGLRPTAEWSRSNAFRLYEVEPATLSAPQEVR